MTIQELFDSVSRIHPHHYETEEMLAWLNEVELTVYRYLEHFDDDLGEFTQHTSTTEEVMADQPKLYSEYLQAMIDFCNEEYDRYNNHAAAYGMALQEWKAWYLRNHKSLTKARIKTI